MNRTVPKVLTPTFSNTGFYLYPMSRANRDTDAATILLGPMASISLLQGLWRL